MFESRRNWTSFEDSAIVALVRKHGTRNWAQISEKMSSKYGIENRTGKQCRERWHNHLDPAINKNAWSEREEKAMFEAHQQHGNKWTEIAKLFPGRTDNDIKNHFYSMLRRSLRRVNKVLGMRNSTQRIKLIKPSVLSQFFSNGHANNDDCKQISSALFEFSKTKSVEGKGLEEAQKKRLQQLIFKIADYNEEYEQSQLERRESRKSEKEQSKKHQQSPLKDEAAQTVKKQQNSQEDEQPQVPLPHKKSSKTAAKSKTKKIRRQRKSNLKVEQAAPASFSPKKQSKRGRKKQQSTAPQVSQVARISNAPPQPPVQPVTRLQRKSSELSIKWGEEGQDMWQLPELQLLHKRSSLNAQSRRASSSGSSSFFNGASPRMDLRIFARTPQYPTPAISDILSRNLMAFDWKANNEELDEIVSQTRRAIERRTG